MMESVDAALKIIGDVNTTADKVCVNKNQCKRLAERFGGIGEALKLNGDTFLETPAMDQILSVLKKGEALVLSYADERNALSSAVNRADNCEAFNEIHEDIDALRTYLDLDQSENLNLDAETDRGEMRPKLHNLILQDVSKLSSGSLAERTEVGEHNVENMEKAVIDKCYNVESNADELSYLNIPFSAIDLQDAIKELKPLSERKSKGDAHLDGLALVHKGKWNGCDCAIKVFKSADIHWNTEELHKEIKSLVKLRHPHITQLIGCAQDDEKTYVLYEKMDSDLRVLMDSRNQFKILPKFLQDGRPFSRTEEVSIITQIARGMFYLHEKKLVHGELKCTNLLVKEVGAHIDVKVADFHCSRQLGQERTTKYKPAHRPRWMPPEDFQYCEVHQPDVDQPSDELLQKGDIYSFAMTCYEVVTGKYPFDGVRGDSALEEKIKAGERPTLPDDLSGDLKSLITKCWHADPEQRPSFEDICYILKVDAVNLSQVQKLLANLCFGTANERVADAPADQEWHELPSFKELKTKSIEEIDDAAKDLPHYLKINPSALKPVRPLGSGASSEVFEASWIGCRFAVKWLKVEHVIKLRQEVSIMMKLLHPHVIRLVGFSVLQNRCAIVMELMDMSLRDLIDSRIKDKHVTPFSESEALAIITKLALGMDFLHSQKVTHGDLKCANVLVRNANTKSRLDVKIVDFGLSQLLGQTSHAKVSLVGRWRAPEIILSMESKEHVDIDSKAADVYSFGMMCYEVITGKMPFYDLSESTAMAVAKGGGVPKLGNVNVRNELKQLLKHCWSLKHQDRPEFAAILERLASMSLSRQ